MNSFIMIIKKIAKYNSYKYITDNIIEVIHNGLI